MAAIATDSPPPSPTGSLPTNPLLVYPDPASAIAAVASPAALVTVNTTAAAAAAQQADAPSASPATSTTLVPPSPTTPTQPLVPVPTSTIVIEDEDSRGNKLAPPTTKTPIVPTTSASNHAATKSAVSATDSKPSRSPATPPSTSAATPRSAAPSTSLSSSPSSPSPQRSSPASHAHRSNSSLASRVLRLLRRAFGPCLYLGKSSSSSAGARRPPARPPRPAGGASLGASPSSSAMRGPPMTSAKPLGAVPEDRQVNSPTLTPGDLITQVIPGGASSPITQVQPGATLTAVGWGRRTPSVRSAASGGSTAAKPLLPPLRPEHEGRKCLVLDLDETLVHSSFKLVPQADYVIPVEIDHQWHNVYVMKRPGLDTFMRAIAEKFEVVVFTASLAKYADPVLDMLDKNRVVHHRLFREACIHHKGNYVKDLSMLGRDLKNVIILDNSPASYLFHRSNAIPITSWFSDPEDRELVDLVPFLLELRAVDNVMVVLGDEDG